MAKNKKATKINWLYCIYPISNIMYTVASMRFISILIFLQNLTRLRWVRINTDVIFLKAQDYILSIQTIFYEPITCVGFRTRF
jgi:hypothetical protein